VDTLETMRAFTAVASEGTFTAAARRLDCSTRQVSKQVRQLEARLEAQLFNRTTRSVVLTDVGEVYLERCRPLLDQFDELEAVVLDRQTELAGPIRMTASSHFGSVDLVAAVGPFLAANPKVTLDLHVSDQRVAIVEEGFDLAIRFGTLEDSTLMARRLRGMRLVVCGSPGYLEDHGWPRHPDALPTHDCARLRTSVDPEHWRFRVDAEPRVIAVSGSFQANAPLALAQMAARGVGLVQVPYYVVEPMLAEGRLQLLLEPFETPEFGLNVVYPPNRHLTARVRALIDHLVDHFRVV